MTPAIINVDATSEYTLLLTFDNDEIREFDMKPYLDIELFKDLKDLHFFKNVRISFDTVSWENEIDIDPELLFNESLKVV